MEDFAIYRTFIDPNLANDIEFILKKQGISTKLIDNSPVFDISFANNDLEKEIQLLIKQSDFKVADEILEGTIETNIDKDHYLFSFSTDELLEVIAKPDEWSPQDYKLSQKILLERGEKITHEILNNYKAKRIKELEKPEKSQFGWIILGYVFALLGGFIGVLIGWFISTLKKTLPDGRKVFTFQQKDRFHGKIIFWIGITVIIIVIIFNFIDFYNI